MHTESRKRSVDSETLPDSTPRAPSAKRSREEDGNCAEVGEANPRAREDEKQYKVFNDSIHGHIEVHPLCVEIIDTPQFQRLRDIKQLGGCYHVFPGASHNRFEHCIGTCYLAGELVKSLRVRQPELGITDEDLRCVEIAGLCHDLGHGPFSHLFDALFIPEARPDANWKHEVASVKMFDHMLHKNKLFTSFEKYNLTERDVTFIKELIAGGVLEATTCTSEDWPCKGRGPEKSFLYEIVANKRTGIDVDKFDYFSRDCHHLGINNSFDHKRYMKFARVIEIDKIRQICVRDKEVDTIYDMFHTRNNLFRWAYKHKTTSIIEKMITEALLKADKNVCFKGSNGKMFSISECIDDMEAYSQLSDHVYYQILNSSDPALEEARKILHRIQCRDLYKFIGKTNFGEPQDKKEIPDIQRHMADCIKDGPKLDKEYFVIDMVTFDYGMKEKDPIDKLTFYDKSKPPREFHFKKEEFSKMIPTVFTEQLFRVFFRKNDPKLLEKAKRCFTHWCNGQMCTKPKERDAAEELTPRKTA